VLTLDKKFGDIPAIPDLEAVEKDDIGQDDIVTVSGYPAITLGNDKEQNATVNKMYSASGKVLLRSGNLFGVDLLTSPGQQGGGMVDKESGKVIGILTGIAIH
jgi:V8-like Glu-specific endopeptidase